MLAERPELACCDVGLLGWLGHFVGVGQSGLHARSRGQPVLPDVWNVSSARRPERSPDRTSGGETALRGHDGFIVWGILTPKRAAAMPPQVRGRRPRSWRRGRSRLRPASTSGGRRGPQTAGLREPPGSGGGGRVSRPHNPPIVCDPSGRSEAFPRVPRSQSCEVPHQLQCSLLLTLALRDSDQRTGAATRACCSRRSVRVTVSPRSPRRAMPHSVATENVRPALLAAVTNSSIRSVSLS